MRHMKFPKVNLGLKISFKKLKNEFPSCHIEVKL